MIRTMRPQSVLVAALLSLTLFLSAGVLALQTPPPTAKGTVTVDLSKPGAAIPPNLYGIFFEEISHAGDGGLYAELVRNRGFEDANLPPACVREGDFIVPPRTPHFDTGKPSDWRLRWDVNDPHPAWTLAMTAGSQAVMGITVDNPLHEATLHSLAINVMSIGANGHVALVNSGHWGIGVKAGEDYELSFWARGSTDLTNAIGATLEPATWKPETGGARAPLAKGARLVESTPSTFTPGAGWKRYTATLHATASDAAARLALFLPFGSLQIDMVSLFPAKTFKNRANGLRPDLAEMIARLKPGFVRGPGGCFAEGITIESRPQWKRSLGPIETRSGTYSPWGYWSTDGFGYHEFLQFAEDIGADALWVVNVGVSCSFRSGTFLPDSELPALIQDSLDAIEYAIGPVTSTWGAVRAKAGHPRPFPLKYIEIGNEQQGARYGERVAKFTQAIKAKYPEIKVALSSWISGIDRRAIDAAGPIDIVDEHAYKAVNWAIENFDSFAKYPRDGRELYIGEFATNAGVGRGNWMAALNDAAYMMSVEKNTDLVKMASYAPLLENVNKRDWEVNMIHFDSSRVFARATYSMQQLFAEHLPTTNLPATVAFTPAGEKAIAGPIGVGTWNTAAEFKDIRVEREGGVVYQSDFAKTDTGSRFSWTPMTGRAQGGRGTWSIADGAYRQEANAIAFSYLTGADAANTTISMKARKISGSEGFLVMGGLIDGRRVQWNVAGWGNTQSAMQATDAIVGPAVRGGIETGRWYDLRLEIRGRTVRGYLDGKLLNEATYPRIDTVLAIAGRDGRTGEIVIKALNTGPDPADITFQLNGAGPLGIAGRMVVLWSPNPTDENSFETPEKIRPVPSALPAVGPTFTRTLTPYSLTILRIPTR